MENIETFYNSICRICLSVGNSNNMKILRNGLSEDGLSAYGKAVEIFANISLNSDDKLPINICENCTFLLRQAIYFKLKCESSERQLKEILQLHTHNDYMGGAIKDMVCQYVLFRHYFPSQCSLPDTQEKKCNQVDSFQDKSSTEVFNSLENIHIDSDLNEGCFDDAVDCLADEANIPCSETQVDTADKLLNQLETMINMIYMPKYRKLFNHRLIKHNIQTKRTVKQIKVIDRKERNYTCMVCQKVLANSHTYEHHMQRHEGFHFICEHCGKGFSTKAELHRHQVAVHGIGPYLQCNHCTYKAPKKTSLIEHLRLHTGERPYTCEKCGLTFRRRAIYKKHLIHHSEKTVQCMHCPRKFFLRSHMLAHVNNIHDRVYVFLCHKCGVTYAKTKTVRRHLTEKHGIPREMQGKIIRITKGASQFPAT